MRRRGTGRPADPDQIFDGRLDLEGCGPSQPRNPIKATNRLTPCPDQTKPLSLYAAPRHRRLQIPIKSLMVALTWRAEQSLAAAVSEKTPTLGNLDSCRVPFCLPQIRCHSLPVRLR